MDLKSAGVRIPIGKYKDTLVSLLPAPYLLWFTSQDNLRRSYPGVVRAMLAVLHTRLAAWPGVIEGELFPPDDGSDLI